METFRTSHKVMVFTRNGLGVGWRLVYVQVDKNGVTRAWAVRYRGRLRVIESKADGWYLT